MTSTAPTRPAGTDRPTRGPIAPIPLGRIVSVELRKMFDTRSGFWLMASIVITAVLATIAVMVFASDSDATYSAFAIAIGFPIALILPIIALLSVTSEWSQRSGLTTFTLVPHRGRILLAKAIATVAVAVASMLLAFGIGALGTLLNAAISGSSAVWNSSATQLLYIVLGNVLGLLFGFMLGVVIRNSPGAIVAYFVNSLVVTTLATILAANNSWFADKRPWLDFNYTSNALFGEAMTGEQWAQLAVTTFFWLVLPLAIGTRLMLRSEVK